jgi:hypothetical protein
MAAARTFGRDAPEQARGFALAMAASAGAGALAAAPVVVGSYLLEEAAEEVLDRVTGLPISLVTAVVDPTEIAQYAAKRLARQAPDVAQEGFELAAKRTGELSSQAQKGIRSLEKRIAEHEAKLADFRANPTVRSGMENLPKEVIEKQQRARIQHLENEILAFRDSARKLLDGGQ